MRVARRRFAILLLVRILNGHFPVRAGICSAAALVAALTALSVSHAQLPQAAYGESSLAQQSGPIVAPPYPTVPQPRVGINVVVIDPAHGGTDPGARGAQGIRESDLLLDFTVQVRRALEAQGYQVLQTRSGNENPSFDDRSTLANAQRGAVFVTLHISSSGIPGTARSYVTSDVPAAAAGSMLSWDHAQAPYSELSRKFGDAVQGQLAQRFKGSPNNAQVANIRQLRTTAAPAIAVEISSVSVQDRADLARMMPGVADAIAKGIAAFRPSYVIAGEPVALPAATPPATSSGTAASPPTGAPK